MAARLSRLLGEDRARLAVCKVGTFVVDFQQAEMHFTQDVTCMYLKDAMCSWSGTWRSVPCCCTAAGCCCAQFHQIGRMSRNVCAQRLCEQRSRVALANSFIDKPYNRSCLTLVATSPQEVRALFLSHSVPQRGVNVHAAYPCTAAA